MLIHSYNQVLGIFAVISGFIILFGINNVYASENNVSNIVTNESVNQSLSNESVNQSLSNESVNQSLSNESVNQSLSNESVNQSLNIDYKFTPFLSLNGTDYVDLKDDKIFSLEKFTVGSWIRVNESDLSNPAIMINKGGFNSEEKGKNMNYGFWFNSKGIIQGGFETDSGEYFAANSTDKYNDGKWHYIVLSNDGNLLKLYVDGKPVSIKATNGTKPDNSGSQPLRIGANSLEEDKFFKGNIDEVRVWNRALTDSEVNDLVVGSFNNTNGQILYLNFTEPTSTQTTTLSKHDQDQDSFKDATEYKWLKTWGGEGTEDGKFLRPHDIDFNNDESIMYIIDRDGGRVQAFDKEGNFLFKFGQNGQGDGEFKVPYGIDVDKEGNIWVADRANHRVQKFDSQGNFILKIGQDDFTKSSAPGEFDNPRHVVVDHDVKYVYVADSKNNRVQQFDVNGTFIKTIGQLGDKPGEFNLVTTIEIDPDGNFFTTERGNERIQKFDANWNPILMWGSKGSGDSQFCHSEHIAIDKYGNVYMNDPQSDPGCSQIPSVKKFDNNGKFITKWGSFGKEPGQFGDPEHLAVDSDGNVYVSDRKNDNIQKFAPVP